MVNMFESNGAQQVIGRINKLTATTKGEWGKMEVAQMLAHCNVAYDMAYTDQYKKPGSVAKFFLKLMVKRSVVGPRPYPKNGRTAPDFIISDERDFEFEKSKLISYIEKTQQHGAAYFDQRESHSFGPLSKDEWNILFYKHLHHHLEQFGV